MKSLLTFFLFLSFFVDLRADRNFNVQKKLANATVTFEGNKLTVSTGEVKRAWLWTGTGFQTVSFKNLKSGKEWCGVESIYASDWNLPERIDNHSKGELISVECLETDDQKFTSTICCFRRFSVTIVVSMLNSWFGCIRGHREYGLPWK